MKKIILILMIIPFLGCNDEKPTQKNASQEVLKSATLSNYADLKKVKIDPHYPNIGITANDLKNDGWELTTMDDGVCVYSRKNLSPELVFYLTIEEGCKTVKSQEIYIDLKYAYKSEFETLNDELISEIDSVLTIFKSKRISAFEKITNCTINFFSENEEKIKIEWSISLCRKINNLSSYFELIK